MISIIIVLALVLSGSPSYAATAGLWTKYKIADGSFSFHIPKGWKITADRAGKGTVTVTASYVKTDEQLLVSISPPGKGKSPTVLATNFVMQLKKSNPSISISGWRKDPDTINGKVAFDLSNKKGTKQYKGAGFLYKNDQILMWCSYQAPATGYSRERGLLLLNGLIGSLASGSGSMDPLIDYASWPARFDADSKGFMFVLEFALGAPLTLGQEKLITDELKYSMCSLPEAEFAQYDDYPNLVKAILTMKQEEMEELRSGLETTIREWIDKSPDSDRTVKTIKDQLALKGKKVIDGEPPLTEMALAAYSEIITYSRLLKKDPKAMPEQITQASVNEVKKQVKDTWKSFTTAEKEQIATAPGMWICLRTELKNADKAQQDKIRSSLTKLSPDETTAKSSSNDAELTKNSIDENLRNISINMMQNQMRINSYMTRTSIWMW